MNLLAIETSTDACSVALLSGGGTLLDHRVEPRRHAQLVLPMIDALLAEAALPRGALDGIAFGRGPGSFTGVRVAAAVTQGIALGLDIGVVGVSTLGCIAEGCRRELGDTCVGVALDARLDEIYWGAFVASLDGIMTSVLEERVCVPEAATLQGGKGGGELDDGREAVDGPTGRPAGRVRGEAVGRALGRTGGEASRWRLAGAGAERYAQALVQALFPDEGERFGGTAGEGDGNPPVRVGRLPNALDTLALASVIIAGEGFGRPESALPVYLRERVARTEAERGVVHGSIHDGDARG